MTVKMIVKMIVLKKILMKMRICPWKMTAKRKMRVTEMTGK